MRAATVALCLTALLAIAAAEYSCPESCNESKTCHCASAKVPGGLDPKDTPLFIVLTNDDAINPTTKPAILNITDRHANKNGCKMPATWFVSTQYTDPGMVQQMYIKGHEIATHTMNHVSDPGADEILGARMWLNKSAGIPLEKLQGFRAPFLLFSPEQREVLAKNGFRYDSTITEPYNSRSTTSKDAANRLWPYTMDYGIAQDCSISTGTCSDSERWPGLWEFPMHVIQDSSGSTLASMDPQGDNYELYKRAFDERYNGNRAPLGIFLHAGWLIAQPAHMEELNRFLDYAMSHDNVFLATVSQVLDWVADPVPASKLNLTCRSEAELKAELPAGQLCVMPTGGCLYGNFNAGSCVCDCQNEADASKSGYCKDSDGRCTVQKGFDFTSKAYGCPAGSASGSSDSAPSTMIVNPCGHDLVPYQGLSLSGSGDSSEMYMQALKAIDGGCDTCTQVTTAPAGGSYYTILLNADVQLSGISVLSTSEQYAIEFLVGSDTANNGLNNTVCAKATIPAGLKTPTVVPCNAKGSVVTLRSPTAAMTLCDIFPIAASGSLPGEDQRGKPSASDAAKMELVMVELEVNGVPVTDFQDSQGPKAKALCEQVLKMTGDDTATCAVVKAVPISRRRQLLEGGSHVTAEVNTTSPQNLISAFSLGAGSSVASALQAGGFEVNAATAKAYTISPDTPTAEPADSTTAAVPAESSSSSSSSSGVPMAAIIGGVVGGIAVLAIVVATVVVIKRRKAAKGVQLSDVSFNAAYDPRASVTATVTTSAMAAKAKLAAAAAEEEDGSTTISPLGSGMAASAHQQQVHPGFTWDRAAASGMPNGQKK